MVAYNFQQGFAPRILDGSKVQTCRLVGKRRHARQGEELQLYTGLRTVSTRLLGRARCESTASFRLGLAGPGSLFLDGFPVRGDELTEFAIRDGFDSWSQMLEWMCFTHGEKSEQLLGIVIRWGALRLPT